MNEEKLISDKTKKELISDILLIAKVIFAEEHTEEKGKEYKKILKTKQKKMLIKTLVTLIQVRQQMEKLTKKSEVLN